MAALVVAVGAHDHCTGLSVEGCLALDERQDIVLFLLLSHADRFDLLLVLIERGLCVLRQNDVCVAGSLRRVPLFPLHVHLAGLMVHRV